MEGVHALEEVHSLGYTLHSFLCAITDAADIRANVNIILCESGFPVVQSGDDTFGIVA
jgi:hypothetical protein